MHQITMELWSSSLSLLAQAQTAKPPAPAAGEDSALLAGIFQAAATVAAVLVGYLLSVLAERKAWSRRKAEQLRERRLQGLIDFIDRVSKVADWAEMRDGQVKDLAARASSPSTPAAREAVMAGARSTLQVMGEEMRAFSGDIGRRFTELRVIRVGAKALLDAEQCVAGVEGMRQSVGRQITDPADLLPLQQKIHSLRQSIVDSLATLTSKAVDSIDSQ